MVADRLAVVKEILVILEELFAERRYWIVGAKSRALVTG
jgi:hypothetical protein